jgi:hypothetical protein
VMRSFPAERDFLVPLQTQFLIEKIPLCLYRSLVPQAVKRQRSPGAYDSG